jgi:S1-C subfamily serine protease
MIQSARYGRVIGLLAGQAILAGFLCTSGVSAAERNVVCPDVAAVSERHDSGSVRTDDLLDHSGLVVLPAASSSPIREIRSTGNVGTGWLAESGLLVTSLHVVRGSKTINVVGARGERFLARYVDGDPKTDIALLAVDRLSDASSRLALAPEPPALGEPVSIIGYPVPSVLGVSPKFHAGTVSGLTGMRDDPRRLQIGATALRGHSGSPVINREGQVVGVITARVSVIGKEVIPNLALAVKSEHLARLMARAGAGLTPRPSGAGLIGREAAVTEMTQAVFLVHASPAEATGCDLGANADCTESHGRESARSPLPSAAESAVP